MTPPEVLADLRTRAKLWLQEGPDGLRPMVQPPASQLAEADRLALRTHREALIALLLAESRQEAGEKEEAQAAVRRKLAARKAAAEWDGKDVAELFLAVLKRTGEDCAALSRAADRLTRPEEV